MQLESVACNLCGSAESERLFEKGGLPVARCTGCGLVYANPRVKWAVLGLAPLVAPVALRSKGGDQLIVLAVR